MRSVFLSIVSLSVICMASALAQKQQYFSEKPLFVNGTHGYACYRIPAIILAPNGDLLAFAEGRINGCGDFGNVDIVMRKSVDNGKTWGAQTLIADNGKLQIGNPAPVVDLLDEAFPNGRVFLFYNTGTHSEHETRQGTGMREIGYLTSIDNGKNWSSPQNITAQVHRPNRPDIHPDYQFQEDWRTYANTPGHALQLHRGEYAGRLFVPANHSQGMPGEGFNDYRAHAFFSDDHGKTWKLSESVKIPSSNESIAAELSDGRVYQNIRHQNGESRNRIVAISNDGGEHWDSTYFDTQLPSPVCQASILEYTTPEGQNVLLFSNPNSQKKREKMTVRVSFDDGKTWLLSREIRAGESAYSDLVAQKDGRIGLLYEHGNDGGIHYAHFNFAWLIGGKNNTDNQWVKKLTSSDLAQGFDFELAPPIFHFEQVFFETITTVGIQLDYPNTRLHYTLNGENPTEVSPLYTAPIQVQNSCELKARAYHDHCRPSPIVGAQFIKVVQNLSAKKITLVKPPNQSYPGTGALGLIDLQKGSSNFRDGKWMGFSGDDVEAIIELHEGKMLSAVTASVLSEQGAWIFHPTSLVVLVSNNGVDFKEVALKEYPNSHSQNAPSGMQFLTVKFEPQVTKFVKIILKNQPSIPDWHAGAGKSAWLFVDELIFN